jgi:outer membrane protein TolC
LFSNSDSAANRLYTVRIDQVFERGNKRSLRTEAAEFQVQAAEAQVLDTIRTQLLQLRQAFYTAVLARENVRVAQENLDLTADTERLIKTRVSAGDAPEWDLIKFQASKVQFQRDLAAARLAYQQAVRDVLTFVGATFPTIGSATPAALAAPIEVIGALRAGPLSASLSLEELHQAALETRPDILAAQRNSDAAQRNLDLAYAQRHRDIDVALEYQRNGGDNTVGATVSFPLFLSHKFEGQINQGLAQVQQARVAFDQAKLQAITDVEKAYQAYQASRHVLQVYTAEALAKAEESFRIAGVSYRQGATSLLELQDAQRTLNQTRVAANQAFFDYRMSLYQLEQATGKSLVKP